MSTETSVTNLKINKVTKAQYDAITRSATEAYEITDLGTVLDGKQATLVSGTNIKTINNESLLGSGNISISGGGTVAIDDSTITKNTSDQLQTVAVKDNRSGNAIKTWTGTKAQYDAITTKDANTLYNITDDTDMTLSLLNTLYPVGAIYIGTMATCPLAVLGVGTWQLVSAGRVLQGVGTGQTAGDTVEAGLPNITGRAYQQYNGSMYAGWHNNTGSDLGEGALYVSGESSPTYSQQAAWSGYTSHPMEFDASRSNPIYGNSTTVQPPAYIVNIWERIS